MQLELKLNEIKEKEYISISTLKLEELKKISELKLEKDTLISGYIRIFMHKKYYFFQETTPKGEILIRKFLDQVDAESLIEKRLNIYEKMWDGCGCKIDYYE